MMNKVDALRALPAPFGTILRDYCHVEWYEVNELAEDVRTGRRAFDVAALRAQFEQMIAGESIPREAINTLTMNEFSSDEEVRDWLRVIYAKVFVL